MKTLSLTRQSEYMGQGYIDRAYILVPADTQVQPGDSFVYGFRRDWIVEEVREHAT